MSEAAYDVAIVGAGPAGLFAAIEISRNRRGLRTCLVDLGPGLAARVAEATTLYSQPVPLHSRSHWQGFGGAGFFLGGRLALDPGSPSSVPSNVGGPEGAAITAYVQSLLGEWEVTGARVENPSERLLAAADAARSAGLVLHLNYPALHLSAEERMRALSAIHHRLSSAGVDIRTETVVDDLRRGADGWRVTVAAAADVPKDYFEAKSLILAPGRNHAQWLAQVLTAAGAETTSRVSVGVRLEVPNAVMAPLTDVTPDPRLIMETESGTFRTYACAKDSHVVVVETEGDRRISLRPGASSPSGCTSFSLLWQLADPTDVPDGLDPLATRLANVDSAFATARFGGSPAPTAAIPLSEQLSPWPHPYWRGLIEFLRRMDQLAPGITDGGNVVYSPAIERYWEYGADSDGRIRVPGIYVAGDGAGLSQGAMAAAVSGVVAGRAVAG